jgi:hypothetical protein
MVHLLFIFHALKLKSLSFFQEFCDDAVWVFLILLPFLPRSPSSTATDI